MSSQFRTIDPAASFVRTALRADCEPDQYHLPIRHRRQTGRVDQYFMKTIEPLETKFHNGEAEQERNARFGYGFNGQLARTPAVFVVENARQAEPASPVFIGR